MSTLPPPKPLQPFESPPFPVRRFTVDEYHQLGEIGVLGPEDNVELLEGWIVQKMNQRPAHGVVVSAICEWLQQNLPAGFALRCQLPITLGSSEPEPDVAIVIGELADFRNRHPHGQDCRLVIEVADTLLTKDRAKALIYAASGVMEYWLVNLVDYRLEVMSEPQDGAFQSVLLAQESIELHLGDQAISRELADLLAEE